MNRSARRILHKAQGTWSIRCNTGRFIRANGRLRHQSTGGCGRERNFFSGQHANHCNWNLEITHEHLTPRIPEAAGPRWVGLAAIPKLQAAARVAQQIKRKEFVVNSLDFTGKVAPVTGAGSGLGLVTAMRSPRQELRWRPRMCEEART